MVGVFVAFIRVVYGRMTYMSLPKHLKYIGSHRPGGRRASLEHIAYNPNISSMLIQSF